MRTYDPAPLSRNDNPLMPGSWEPGRFHLTDAVLLKVTLILMAAWRGFDYLAPSSQGWTPVTETMYRAFPFEVWAAMALIPAGLLSIGLALRIHFAVWIGHGLLAVTYVGLFTSLMSVYVQRDYFDGIRSATVLLAPLVLHTLLCIRTGWRPPKWAREGDAHG